MGGYSVVGKKLAGLRLRISQLFNEFAAIVNKVEFVLLLWIICAIPPNFSLLVLRASCLRDKTDDYMRMTYQGLTLHSTRSEVGEISV